MIVEGARLDPSQYTVQYELLRSQVIGTVGDVARGDTADQTRGIGLALLLSEGLPGWLKSGSAEATGRDSHSFSLIATGTAASIPVSSINTMPRLPDRR
jgi:hypothetical protein